MTNENAYAKGFEAKSLEIREIGFVAARDKFNAENPTNVKYSSLAAYHYAKGELEALVKAL